MLKSLLVIFRHVILKTIYFVFYLGEHLENNYPDNWDYGNHIFSINPISWDINEDESSFKDHMGILLPNKLILFKNTLSVFNKDGLLFLKKPKNLFLNLYPSKNYHPGDYNLYWENIRENLKIRLNNLN